MPGVRWLAGLVLALLAGWAAAGSPAPPTIAVIVSPANAQLRLDLPDIALVYQRKRQYWPDGTRVQPVNLAADQPLRQAFSRAVFGADPAALDSYWNELYFRGVRPPYVVASNEAVLRFVAQTPGAIGYVDACLTSSAVAVIGLIDSAGHWHRGATPPGC